MTAEETKAAESGAQSAPLPLEGVDISPKQDEGVLKVRGGGAPGRRGAPRARRCRAPVAGRGSGLGRPPLQPPGRPLTAACSRGRAHRLAGRAAGSGREGGHTLGRRRSGLSAPQSPRPGSAAPAPAAACAGRGAPGGRARELRGVGRRAPPLSATRDLAAGSFPAAAATAAGEPPRPPAPRGCGARRPWQLNISQDAKRVPGVISWPAGLCATWRADPAPSAFSSPLF